MTFDIHTRPLTGAGFCSIVDTSIGLGAVFRYKNSMLGNIHTYLVEAVAEMRKDIWPTKKQTVNYTLLVIVLSVGVAASFGILDYVLNLGLESIIK